MKKLLLLSLCTSLLVACGGGTSTPSDSSAPTITSAYPSLFKDKLRIDGPTLVYFSEAMDKTSVISAVQLVDASNTPAPILVTTTGRIATLTPTVPLKPNAQYTLVVNASAKDEAGNPLAAEYRQSYTTEPTPYRFKLSYYLTNTYSTAVVRAFLVYLGKEEAGVINIRATCREDGYPNLSTSLNTVSRPEKWTPNEGQPVLLQHSGGFSYFTGNPVRCTFSSNDSENTNRIILE